ncbi:Tumor necrosis factor ligand superfamily member 14 [Merluccius polli]|uniref:Tumor necrosis factor ligand superfamily member 14 n=1 Tax=Merluccius polli TaxID=89951 RepID=A0AA47MAH8_MERPO|nr:Tumor necrosis factor ligand superfamily member 14 [Merluccius polli]
MSVAGPETSPQLFVVDSQVAYAHLPSGRHRRKPSALQMFLFLLVGLALLGVVIEGCFIYYLYNKTQVGTTMSQIGAKETTRAQPATQRKPSAHLSGSTSPKEGTMIIQWDNINSTATFTYQMDYKNGLLIVPEEGFYYLYSKVSTPEWTYVKFMRKTKAYDKPIELMHSKRFSYHDGRPAVNETFLGGIFHLMPKDEVYVTLGRKMKQLNTESFIGIFMLY